jgi:hypothetical protein
MDAWIVCILGLYDAPAGAVVLDKEDDVFAHTLHHAVAKFIV